LRKSQAALSIYLNSSIKSGTRSVLGLGTGQRNLSAAVPVAGQNFSE
jgi:hypothetical protein